MHYSSHKTNFTSTKDIPIIPKSQDKLIVLESVHPLIRVSIPISILRYYNVGGHWNLQEKKNISKGVIQTVDNTLPAGFNVTNRNCHNHIVTILLRWLFGGASALCSNWMSFCSKKSFFVQFRQVTSDKYNKICIFFTLNLGKNKHHSVLTCSIYLLFFYYYLF